jgi:predicted acylesterase/phospholipase RssA
MVIQHLVIAGGGPTGLYTHGAAKYLSNQNVWNINNIKTIYGTSMGAIMGVVFSLKYDWDIIDDYIIKRPWEKIINLSPDDIFHLWESKGLLDSSFIREALRPLLEAKELNVDITLEDFYAFNQIEIHMFAVNLNEIPLVEVDISYKTHPKLSLIDALTMTSAVPFLFKPFLLNDGCFIDGGIIVNYPIDMCLKGTGCDESEILAFKNKFKKNPEATEIITKESSIIFFLSKIIKSLIKQIKKDNKIYITNTVICEIENVTSIVDWVDIFITRERRIQCIQNGEKAASVFMSNANSNEKNINIE